MALAMALALALVMALAMAKVRDCLKKNLFSGF